MHARAYDHPAAPGTQRLFHAHGPVYDAARWKIGRRHDLDQFLDADLRILQQRLAGVDDFAEIVRRNIGRHADRDTRRSIDQQVGYLRRQYQRLVLGSVVIGTEVYGFLVDVIEEFLRDARHADFGVTHCRRVIAIDRSEIALTIDQRITQREILRHAHDGVVDRGIAVGMVFTDHIAHDARRFFISTIPFVRQLVHRKKHAAMHRLEAVPDIRQSAPDDDAHRVIEIGPPHFFFEAYRDGFFGELVHADSSLTVAARREIPVRQNVEV